MKELWEARELMWSFAVRELSVRYKQSFFGVLWALLQPLSQLLVFTIIFSRVAHVGSEGLPYPLFSFAALMPWTLFAASMGFAIPSLASNADLINKVYFPRMAAPLSTILVAGADFLIAWVPMLVLMMYYQVTPTWAWLWLLPLLLLHVTFTAAVCLILSALNVFYRDVRFALPLLTQLWIYKVPVIYSAGRVPQEWRALYMADPMAVVVDGFRQCLLHGKGPLPQEFLMATVIAVGLLGIAVAYFRWVEQAFADIV